MVRSGTKVDQEVIDAGKNLKLIGRAGTGVDNIDVKHATSKNILVVNTPGGNTISTGELAFSHLLALARKIPQATASLKKGAWNRSEYTGSELSTKTLGIIGCGQIGKQVAVRAKAFGMKVIGYDPVMSPSALDDKSGIQLVELDELFAQCDFITLHTPLTQQTKYLINTDTIKQCKQGVKIINCARGGIINEDDLLEGIKSGHVGGAALDVFEVEPPREQSHELRTHDDVIVTPHQGASTVDAQIRVAHDVARNMSDILDGGKYRGVVNAPDFGLINSKGPEIKRYMELAEAFGAIMSQRLSGQRLSSVHIDLYGSEINSGDIVSVMKQALLKGALTQFTSQSVTLVNASSIAEALGLAISSKVSKKTPASSGFRNQMRVTFTTNDGASASIEGTIINQKHARITNMDGYRIDCPPGKFMIFFENNDQPGVLHAVAKAVAADGINIDTFSLGRGGVSNDGSMGNALGALVIDKAPSKSLMRALASMDIITNVSYADVPMGEEKKEDGKPEIRPKNPEFSSGPCKKRPGWHTGVLRTDVLGRSHRSKLGKHRLAEAIDKTKSILHIPDDYLVGIVPASDTGAYEMAMWSMLGCKPVDACYWESFGKGWFGDVKKHLKLDNVTEFSAPYGELPNLQDTNKDHDILFTYNGTTSGVRVPNLDWIADDRTGLTFNDATSAAFAMDIDWSKVDVTTYSWQKVLGGEGAHGVMILSPRAVERLETFVPDRPLPKIFRLTKEVDGKTKINSGIFKGETINTPSMLCVEDYIDALDWSDSIGGLDTLIKRSQANLAIIEKFCAKHPWINFLASDPTIRSSTSVCLTMDLSKEQVKKMVTLLENEGVAYDINAYRDSPVGLRIWCGATVQESDLEALMPWLKWAYDHVNNE